MISEHPQAPETSTSVVQLLHAIRLACPSLPIGAYAYSQGLEYAVECGWITDRQSAERWISGLLRTTIARFDVPLLSRLFAAFERDDWASAIRYDQWVLAGRETAELQNEEQRLGAALVKLLTDLGHLEASGHPLPDCGYLAAFALAGVRLGLSKSTTLASYCFAWLEHQTSAVTRLIPLGQTDGQLVLSACLGQVSQVIATGLALSDDEVGALAPGQALASALHETQYCRLFRS